MKVAKLCCNGTTDPDYQVIKMAPLAFGWGWSFLNQKFTLQISYIYVAMKGQQNFAITRPRAGLRLGLGGSLGGYSSHGYTSHASLRAYGTQL